MHMALCVENVLLSTCSVLGWVYTGGGRARERDIRGRCNAHGGVWGVLSGACRQAFEVLVKVACERTVRVNGVCERCL